jgi:hypothetical protein
MLLERRPDRLAFYVTGGVDDAHLTAWTSAVYPHVVEARLVASPLVREHFEPRAFLPLGHEGAGYVVLFARP